MSGAFVMKRRKSITAILMTLTLFAFGLSARAAQHSYHTYHNARFDFSISYPADVLIPQGEPENHDGQKFRSRDGRAEMLVYGSHNALNQTLRQLYSEETNPSADHPDRTVSYKTFKGNWFVVSGIEGGKVFYQKTMLTKGIFKTFRIEYDESQKDLYDSLTTQMVRSFRG
jgi:hypothetical protein